MSGQLPSNDRTEDAAFFERTGHCGQCGQPGGYCLCTPRAACGCAHMHEMGSGLDPAALEQFVAAASVDQGELF